MKIRTSLIGLGKIFKDFILIYPSKRYQTTYENQIDKETSSVHRRRDLDSL